MWPPAPQLRGCPQPPQELLSGPGSGILSHKGAAVPAKHSPDEPPEREEAEGGEDTLNAARDGLLHLQPVMSPESRADGQGQEEERYHQQ